MQNNQNLCPVYSVVFVYLLTIVTIAVWVSLLIPSYGYADIVFDPSQAQNQPQAPKTPSPEAATPEATVPLPPTLESFHTNPRLQKIALLLPLSGTLESVGQAIINGYRYAWELDPHPHKPSLEMIDTHEETHEQIERAYRQAVTRGAQLIVGPLNKTAVAQLANISTPVIPILALNYTKENLPLPEETTHPYFYQLGLSAEDEAIATAQYALQHPYTRSLLFAENSAWGHRMVQAYTQHFTQQGGRILQTVYVDTDPPFDFKSVIRNTLGISYSELRRQKLLPMLGKKTAYQPRPRQDMDHIVLFTQNQSARQIRPLLQFYFVGDRPTLGISTLYSPQMNPDLNQDLEGIEFCDIPWLIKPSPNERAQQAALSVRFTDNFKHFKRFYALGMDSYALSHELTQVNPNYTFEFQGYTGQLTLTGSAFKRALPWSRIENGVPKNI